MTSFYLKEYTNDQEHKCHRCLQNYLYEVHVVQHSSVEDGCDCLEVHHQPECLLV